MPPAIPTTHLSNRFLITPDSFTSKKPRPPLGSEAFSSWYNNTHGRRGTLWARYKSVLVENGNAARTMAAYIELNPVRASMVENPKAYRWCGYAVAGGQLACNGV
ncbi:transposase [Rubritalea tangerina]|uniref:transposase n=1 Tax=Rubritalea tangerina TaxID=430798 RepID=UPI00360FDEAF